MKYIILFEITCTLSLKFGYILIYECLNYVLHGKIIIINTNNVDYITISDLRDIIIQII